MENKYRIQRRVWSKRWHWRTIRKENLFYLALVSYAYFVSRCPHNSVRLVAPNGARVLPTFGWLRGRRPKDSVSPI